MRPVSYFTLFFCILLLSSSCSQHDPIDIGSTPDRGFRSNRPADKWEEGLVSGNGIMGAMVMGHPLSDTIIVNHASLYMPVNEPLEPVSQGDYLEEIRSLMLDGQYGEASRFVVDLSHEEGWEGKRWTDPIIPAFDIVIDMEQNSVKDYARTVNFETGEAEVKWSDSTGTYSRKTFVSRADNIIVTLIRADGSPVGCRISLKERHLESWWGNIDRREQSGIEEVKITAENGAINYRSSFVNQWEGLIEGYEGVVLVANQGGSLENGNGEISVENADEILLITRVEPTYDYSVQGTDKIRERLADIRPDYKLLLKEHLSIHGEIFNRTKLDIGGLRERKNLPVEELLEGEPGTVDPALIEMQFDAARYNIISSTGINPPNLQGLWGGTLTPPWSGDFTMNGNVPVAVSSMLCANMPELKLSLFDMLERHMDDFRLNARKLYNAGGIHVPSRMSSHGLNNHFDATWPMTFWTGGAGWYSMFYYDYYLHTGDIDFLKKRALPFMEEAIAFYEDFLITGDDGKYIFIPSYSPENNPSNIPYQACINATMDVMIARQLFRNIISASDITGTNTNQIEKWQDMLARMASYELNEDGELREWIWPGVEENHSHRHVSQFYALFDMMDPEFRENPELIEGARKVIETKMNYRRQADGGVMSFGMVQLAFAAAMAGEAETCYDMLGWLSRNFWFNNMVTTHDPGHIFNLDLSGGFPAVIIKMMVYSEPGLISVFPALPEQLQEGKIEGVLLRGNMELTKLEWEGEHLNIALHSAADQDLVLELPKEIATVKCKGAVVQEHPDTRSLRLVIDADTEVRLDIQLKGELVSD
jgi:alpha-L-fucosidase 2